MYMFSAQNAAILHTDDTVECVSFYYFSSRFHIACTPISIQHTKILLIPSHRKQMITIYSHNLKHIAGRIQEDTRAYHLKQHQHQQLLTWSLNLQFTFFKISMRKKRQWPNVYKNVYEFLCPFLWWFHFVLFTLQNELIAFNFIAKRDVRTSTHIERAWVQIHFNANISFLTWINKNVLQMSILRPNLPIKMNARRLCYFPSFLFFSIRIAVAAFLLWIHSHFKTFAMN